ncbi:glyoxalase [Halobacillus halophilus]|uniref:Catechol-2,3-dioxygenase n=1 Tax=Halobacillus halophilus (strain ATCC 35676 / DSM 2266 / JCM 20832 / KCTC 3685 / LMG 17431 / NBRC 102448 / NCIMB 2269) TaxID=866895 RepID=I0JRC1_HALH3|nr:VOC family protein [Halobacillus halophilus]ASF40674.1 glyoxalase [Halobacillus halophilus]CCG46691.1 catechol-2,3-dioxygenase [Halobacillus halophilus DSM 2266]
MESVFFQSPSTYVGTVELNVQQLTRSIQFYTDVIGLRVIEQTEHKAVLSADGTRALLTIEQSSFFQPKGKSTAGLYHFALLLPDRLSLAKVYKHLADRGIRLGAADHLVSEALYLNDPDGNGIEIYRDRPSKTWTWHDGKVAMTVDPLDSKGILAELNGDQWEGLPADTIIGHVHLHVHDLDQARHFYCDGLGFEITSDQLNQALFLSSNGYHHHLGLNTWQGTDAPPASDQNAGLKQYTLLFPDQAKRDQAVQRLKELGYGSETVDEQLITSDPSGNRVILAF